MPMSRRALAAAAVTALVLPLSACGSSDGGGGTTDASGKVEGDITFETWNLRANFKDYFEGLIADFEKKYPGTHVKWIDQPAEGYADKISADAAGGTLPDVVNVSPDLAAPLAEAGLAMDLDKAAAQYKSEYLPGAWAGHQVPGLPGTYAFPWYLNTGPLFYNKALFKQAGLDADKPPKTYDELFADALQLAQKSGGKVATLANVPTIEDFGRYGSALMNKDGTGFAFNDAKGVELLTKYKQLYDAKALDPQALTATPESTGKKFLTGAGTIAAAVSGASDSGSLDSKAAQVSGDAAATAASIGHTGWPYVAAAGGALILLAGLLALRFGRLWPAMSGRYERSGAPRPRAARPVDPDRPEDLWKALDRGEDPTGTGPA
ncbi:TIGR02234 family membrane protein [Streptomyces sp. SID89]|nr:TIGR02234 family membrane protein [Streptomyces sp. SID89]